MTLKWENYTFRSTAAGSWSGGVPDPQTSTDETNIQLGTTHYPATGLNGKAYGLYINAGNPSASDTSSAAASAEPLLSGSHSLTSSNQHYQFDSNPGTFDYRLAMGSSTAVTPSWMIVDGDLTTFLNDTNTPNGGPKFYFNSTAYALNDLLLASDGGFWNCTVAGTSSASGTGPSGSTIGTVTTDGTATFTRNKRSVLASGRGVATASGSSVINHAGSVLATSAWKAAATGTITISGNYGNSISLLRPAANPYWKQFSLRAQTFNLVDVTVRDEYGADKGATPTVHAGEPSGVRLLQLAVTSGSIAASAFTLSGTLSPYYSVVDYANASWLVTNGTRIPDSLQGSRSLIILQTDAESTNGTHSTTLTCMVVSSQGRPTDSSYVGQMRTRQYVLRKKVLDVHAASLWQGYTGGGFSGGDVTVTSASELVTAINSIPQGGTTWYRIRLQNGTYTGNATLNNHDFGTGGLLIEPDSGHDPELSMSWNGCVLSGVHIRNCKYVPDTTKMGAVYQIYLNDGSSTLQSRVVFENNRCGLMFGSGYTETNIISKAGSVFYARHGRSIYIKNNKNDGNGVGYQCLAVYALKYEGNDYMRFAGDLRKVSANAYYNTPYGINPDDNQYVWIDGETVRRTPDYAGYTTGSHVDYLQVATFQNNSSFWFPNAKKDNQTYAWVVGDYMIQNVDYKIYQVAASTTGITGSTMPTTNTSGIVDGGVTWNYISALPRKDTYCVVENVVIDSVTQFVNSGNVQFIINSNGQHGALFYFMVANCHAGSTQIRGIDGDEGETWSFRNSLTIPSGIYSGQAVLQPYHQRYPGGQVNSFRDIYAGALTTSLNGTFSIQGSKRVDFSSAAATGERPNDILAGTFSVANGFWLPAGTPLTNITQTQTAFRAAIEAAYRVADNSAGASFASTTPTAITTSLSGSTSIVGAVVTVTYALDAPALVAVTITPTTTLTGNFSASTATIAIGATSTSVTFTSSAASAGNVGGTNSASGLTGPTTVSHTVSVAPTSPTTVGLAGTGSVVAVGTSDITLTYNLDVAAITAVLITPTLAGLVGTFTPTSATIAIGATSTSFLFTPGTSGVGTLGSTDNSTLSNPTKTLIVVLPTGNPTVGFLRRTGIH